MRRTILIIDDEVIWLRLLKRLLSGAGCAVYTAAACAEGVRLAELYRPDCVLLNFHLSDGNAVSVCSALKANKETKTLPVIIYSSDPGVEMAAYAECRAACFILKAPGSVTKLPGVIENVLSPRLSTQTGV